MSALCSFLGGWLSDRYGRRVSLIFGPIASSVAFAAAMVANSQSGVTSYTEGHIAQNPAATRTDIAFLMLSQGVYGLTIATATWTYPSEVLSTKQRTTGMVIAILVFKLSRKWYLRFHDQAPAMNAIQYEWEGKA